jgi:hypothetical protein
MSRHDRPSSNRRKPSETSRLPPCSPCSPMFPGAQDNDGADHLGLCVCRRLRNMPSFSPLQTEVQRPSFRLPL